MTTSGKRRGPRFIFLRYAVAVLLAQSALVLAMPEQAPADTLCSYPGHTSWTLNGSQVQSAIWLANVTVIDTQSSPPTQTLIYPTLSTAGAISTASGNVIRAQMYGCNSIVGPSGSYAGIYQFRGLGSQPNWNSHDKVGFDSNHLNKPVLVGQYFQQIGLNADYTITPILQHYEVPEAQGPALTVTSTAGDIATADTRGPANGTCGHLSPGQYAAQISDGSNLDHGVWDNLKGGIITGLNFDTLRNHINVTIQAPTARKPIKMNVGDPVTVQGATPSAYNGVWSVTDVTDPLHFTTTGPTGLRLNDGHGGTALRYYSSGEKMPMGISLAGWVSVCAGSPGVYFGTEKLEPPATNPPMLTVRWESESRIPGTMPQNTWVSVKWYQTMPCKEAGELYMYPRLVATPGPFPDSNILVEGPPFEFNVVTGLASRC